MNTDFIKGLRKVFGQDKYPEMKGELKKYLGISCALYEKNNILIIQIDSYINDSVLEKNLKEMRTILPIALDYYSQISLIFDDIVFVLEFLSKMNIELKTFADKFYKKKRESTLQKKHEISIYDDNEFLMEYLSTSYNGLIIEIQNFENAYGVLKIQCQIT